VGLLRPIVSAIAAVPVNAQVASTPTFPLSAGAKAGGTQEIQYLPKLMSRDTTDFDRLALIYKSGGFLRQR
jgi:hypothetical protein